MEVLRLTYLVRCHLIFILFDTFSALFQGFIWITPIRVLIHSVILIFYYERPTIGR